MGGGQGLQGSGPEAALGQGGGHGEEEVSGRGGGDWPAAGRRWTAPAAAGAGAARGGAARAAPRGPGGGEMLR